MNLSNNIPSGHLLKTGLAGFFILIIITVLHHQPPLFDEVLFIPNVYLYEEQGLTSEFLRNMTNQAPGPLYQFVHVFFKPLTHYQNPQLRLVNVFLLILTFLLIAKIITLISKTRFTPALTIASGIIAIPMMWQISGMALTEIPAIFFGILSLLLFILAMSKEESKPVLGYLLAITGGISLGLSILGRSPFLLLGVAAPVFILYKLKSVKRWANVLLFLLPAAAICIPVFMIWGGLYPPQQRFVSQGGISIWNGILSLAYGAIVVLLIAPRWYIFNKRVLFLLIGGYIVLLLLNYFVLKYTYYPLSITLLKVFPPSFMSFYPYIIAPFLGVAAIYFSCCSLVRLYENRHNPYLVFFLAIGFLLLLSSFKVTHLFSSRYVAQAAPFLLIACKDYDRWSLSRLFRLIIGIGIGILSLETYFSFR